MQDDGNGKVRDERTKTLVMPLQNGIQKEKGWVPTFVGMTMTITGLTSNSLLTATRGFNRLKPPFFLRRLIDINRKPFRQFLPRVPFVEVAENWGYNLTCW